MNKSNSQKGFSLVELLISLSLLLVVLIMIYSFYYFERKTFERGEDQSVVQENVVLAAQFITDEIRNAEELSLEDSYESGTGDCFIFVEDSVLKYDDGSGSIIEKTDAVIKEFTADLIKAGSKYKVKFYIAGKQEFQHYDISTEVVLNNVKNANPSSGKTIIRYKKP